MAKNSINSQLLDFFSSEYDKGTPMKLESDRKSLFQKFCESTGLKPAKPQFSNRFSDFIQSKNLNPLDFNLRPQKSGKTKDNLSVQISDGSVNLPEFAKSEDLEIIKNDLQQNAAKVQDIDSGKESIKISNGMVGGFFVGIWKLFQVFIPMFRHTELTKEDKDDLGEVWQPIFQQYLGNSGFTVIIPLLVTFNIAVRMIGECKKKQDALTKKFEKDSISESKEKPVITENTEIKKDAKK